MRQNTVLGRALVAAVVMLFVVACGTDAAPTGGQTYQAPRDTTAVPTSNQPRLADVTQPTGQQQAGDRAGRRVVRQSDPPCTVLETLFSHQELAKVLGGQPVERLSSGTSVTCGIKGQSRDSVWKVVCPPSNELKDYGAGSTLAPGMRHARISPAYGPYVWLPGPKCLLGAWPAKDMEAALAGRNADVAGSEVEIHRLLELAYERTA